MNKIQNQLVDDLIARHPELCICADEIISAFNILKESYEKGCKLLVAGNGGSASDSEHIVGELMKSFIYNRPISSVQSNKLKSLDSELGEFLCQNLQSGLPSVSLVGETALTTAIMNDVSSDIVFAQKVNGLGKQNDVFLGISTSGNSKNILYAAITAKSKGLKVIGLTGNKANKLEKIADVCIHAPSAETYLIQEYHISIYHTICLMLETYFFKKNEIEGH